MPKVQQKQTIIATPNPNKNIILQKTIVKPKPVVKKQKNIVVANPNTSLKKLVLPEAIPMQWLEPEKLRKLESGLALIYAAMDLFVSKSGTLETYYGIRSETPIPRGTPVLYIGNLWIDCKAKGEPLKKMTTRAHVFLSPKGIVIPKDIRSQFMIV